MKKDIWAADDSGNPRLYTKIFSENTLRKFIVMMALYADYHRGGRFCNVAKALFAGRRSVFAINESRQGTFTMSCRDASCLGPRSSAGTGHWMTVVDVQVQKQ